jgi:hypothetical protein
VKHKYSEIIKAFADGIECEGWDSLTQNWFAIEGLTAFDWVDDARIKPEPKPDVVGYMLIGNYRKNCITNTFWCNEGDSNLKLTWDGETGEFKSIKVIK